MVYTGPSLDEVKGGHKNLCRPKKAGAGQRMPVTAACQQFGGHMSEWNGNKPGQYYKFSNTCTPCRPVGRGGSGGSLEPPFWTQNNFTYTAF